MESESNSLPSYLRDSSTTALPDFVDADPVPDHVRLVPPAFMRLRESLLTICLASSFRFAP
jgi:hypothetical protein